MKDEPQQEKCQKCGGTRSTGKTGTITQWISTCNCYSLPEEETGEKKAIEICANCGKRMNPGRTGSFTQWIFRLDVCSCEDPQPILTEIEEDDERSFSEYDSSEQDFEPEEELEVDRSKFPADRYKPISVIGQGSSGTVYACWDRYLNKKIALKTLNFLEQDHLVAFQREAQATSKLTHPNIVQVLDFGVTAAGVPFMAMEFIDGMSLFDYINQNSPLEIDQAVELFTLICRGLSHAHQKGIYHRDIKSSNLLVNVNHKNKFDVRLIDFGVATFQVKEDKEESKGSNTSNIVGSPAYMAPDLALGKIYDQRSEIYGLGCTIFEALTGRTPFLGETAIDTLRQHAEDPPPALSDVVENTVFPEEIEELVKKCLSKSPDDRYQSVDELKETLISMQSAPTEELAKEEQPKSIEWTQLKGITDIPKSMLLIIGVAALAIGIGVSLMTVKETKKPHKNVIEKDLPLTNLTDLVGSAVSAHFSEDKLESGLNRLRGRGEITDTDLVKIKDRKDVEELLIYSVNLPDDGITNKGVTDIGIKNIVNLPIKKLVLRGVNVTDDSIDSIAKIKTLVYLDITNTKITNKGLKEIESKLNLLEFKLGGKNVDGKSLSTVGNMKNLRELELYHVRNVPKGNFAPLAKLRNLNKFDINVSKIEPGSLKFLARTKVKHLVVSNTTLGTEDTRTISRLPLLSLKLLRYKINPRDFRYFSKINSLKDLDLTKCYLNDTDLKYVGRMKNLRTLILRNNLITQKGLQHLKGLKSLKLLDVRRCPGLKDTNSKKLASLLPGCQILTAFEHEESNRVFAEATDSILESSNQMRHQGRKIFDKQ